GSAAPPRGAWVPSAGDVGGELPPVAPGAVAVGADAARAWEALPRPYAVLLARAAQARCLAAAGRRDAATALTETARAGLRELGATYAVSRLAALTGHEASPSGPGGPVRGPRGYGDQLSPRELEAVRHMLNGLTNPEIARALYRSPKTIAAQLKSAMRKHGVTSRTALAVSALRAGITPAEPAGDARTGA
ncbi:response regulator transcription factor, partial [Streptomyces sp. NPDC058317]|uniref:helix-turn-helix transcriptional regulator n=1 Tax=Streptomyces sp. NPDC058317 TaxID=3346443 RepID=UPI0036E8C7F8